MSTLTAEEKKLIEEHRARTARSQAPTGGAKTCVVIRESSKKALAVDSDLPEFHKMAQQVLDSSAVRDLPGASTIRALAVDIVKEGARSREIREQLGAEAIYDGRLTVGYQIRVEDVLYVLAVFSAAKTKVRVQDDIASIENAFSDAIARLVRIHGIKAIHTGPFHRLVRHKKASESLETALQLADTVVHFSGGELHMGQETGRTMWTIQVLMAEAQYKGTVSGLTNGAMQRLEEGQWPKSGTQLPAAGYRLRSETDPTVEPDLQQVEMIRELIGWAADERISDAEIATLLGEKYGFVSGVGRSRGNGGTIADSRYPATAVRNLLRKGLPLWRDGVYRYRTEIPQHMETEKLRPGTAALVEADSEGRRFATFALSFHHDMLPEGRWADEETIDAAIRLRLSGDRSASKPSGRGSSEAPRKPLAGIGEWTDGGRQWRLSARHRTFYRLVSRPEGAAYSEAGQPQGWSEADYRDIEAAVGPEQLHPALAEAIAEGLTSGAAWARTAAPTVADPEAARALAASLAADIEQVDEKIGRAEDDLDLAREAGLRETMKDRLAAIERLRRERGELVSRLARAEGAIADVRALADGAAADGKQLAALLASLASCENTGPAELNERLRETLVDLTAAVAADGLTVTVSCRVKVPTSDGQIIAGPFSCTVPNRRRRLAAARAEGMLRHVLAEGASIEQAAEAVGYSDLAHARRQLMRELQDAGVVPSKGLRAALLEAPAEVRAVMWAEIVSRRETKPFRRPASVSATFAQHVREVYTADTDWHAGWATDTAALQAAAELVADTGDEGMLWDELLTQAPAEAVSRHGQQDLVLGRGQQESDRRTSYPAVLERSELWHRHAQRKVFARRCPHCAKRHATRVLRAPEVPGGIICTGCRRTLDGPYGLRMPESYI